MCTQRLTDASTVRESRARPCHACACVRACVRAFHDFVRCFRSIVSFIRSRWVVRFCSCIRGNPCVCLLLSLFRFRCPYGSFLWFVPMFQFFGSFHDFCSLDRSVTFVTWFIVRFILFFPQFRSPACSFVPCHGFVCSFV